MSANDFSARTQVLSHIAAKFADTLDGAYAVNVRTGRRFGKYVFP